MFRVVSANQFHKRMGTGRTSPCLISCVELNTHPLEDEEESPSVVELIVKFSDGCHNKHQGLVAEAFAAMLATDLDLPVPEAFLVQIEPEFVTAITDDNIRSMAQRSSTWAFGSKKLPPQYATIAEGIPLARDLVLLAAEILAFDQMIANFDRRADNPNCLYNGSQLAIIDHELAFPGEGLVSWRPPWQAGGVTFAPGASRHVFLDAVRRRNPDFSRLQGALEAITPGRIEEYRKSLPKEWGREDAATDRKLTYIFQLRDNAAAAIQQITTALQ